MWDEAPLEVSVVIPGSLSHWWRAGVSRARPVKHQCWLVALFFFPGVGVVDDQVGQGEGAGGFGGGDQAVDRLGLPRERIRGRPTPRRGQRDLAVLMRVGPIEPRTPPLRRRVVMADQAWVLVRINTLMPGQARGGGHRVGRAIAPVPLVVHRCERDRDFATKQRDCVGLGWIRDRDDCGNESVRVGHLGWLFVDAGAVGVDGGGSAAQNRPG